MIIFIAAHGKNNELGFKGKLPWMRNSQKDDLKRLHELADGKPIVLGERTYHNYSSVQRVFKTQDVTVLSRDLKNLAGTKVLNDTDSLLERSKNEDLWVIGGGNVFAQLLPHASRLYLTIIEDTFEADTFFPEYDLSQWRLVDQHNFPADENNAYPYRFVTYQRK